MRKLHLQSGGRPRSLDDLQVLTDHITKGTEALYKGRGAFIVQGCEVVGVNAINPGIVFIDGNLIEFAGAAGVAFPAYIKADAEVFDVPQVYESGDTKTTQRVITASVTGVAPGSGEYITVYATGGQTWFDIIGLRPATPTNSGLVSTGTQKFAGDKEFIGTSPGTSLSWSSGGATKPGYLYSDTDGVGITSAAGTAFTVGAYFGLTDLHLYTNAQQKVTINEAGNVGIGTTTPNAPLQLVNGIGNRRLVIYESANNDNQYIGFGVNANVFRYQVDDVAGNHVWYAGASATTSSELMRLAGTGHLHIKGAGAWNTTYQLKIGTGNLSLGENTTGGEIQTFSGKTLYINPLGNDVNIGESLSNTTINGKVGIGMEPTFALDVSSATLGFVRVTGTGTEEVGYILNRTGGMASQWQLLMPTGSTDLRFYNTADKFIFSTTGVGTATNWTWTSDRRKKTNIKPLCSDLTYIKSIASLARSYKWKESGKEETGFIAQDLRAIAPEYVYGKETKTSFLSVDYSRMVVPLYTGMVALIDRIIELETKLKAHGLT